MICEPPHWPNQPVTNTLGEDRTSHLEAHHSRRAILRKLENDSIYSADFAAVAVDELLVENVTNDMHSSASEELQRYRDDRQNERDKHDHDHDGIADESVRKFLQVGIVIHQDQKRNDGEGQRC